MTYKDAQKQLRKIGTAHASGDSLCAMYAKIIPFHCCIAETEASHFYSYLKKFPTDGKIAEAARAILQNPITVFDVLQ